MSKKKKLDSPIIFFGVPRSGTSVISEICMRHKDLGFPSQYQARYPNFDSINYMRRLFDNSLWRFHGQKKQLNKVEFLSWFTFRNDENYAMWDKITGDTIDFSYDFLLNTVASNSSKISIRNFFASLVNRQGKKRLAFKLTGPSRLEYLLSIFPDAKLVRIHRKPIPAISSLLKVDFWGLEGAKQLWWKGPYSKDEIEWSEKNIKDPVAMTAFQLKKIIDTTDEEIQKLGVDVHNVEYGNFIKDPKNTLKGILDFTNLSYDKACFDYFKKNKIHNQNKKDTDYFSQEDLNTIKKIFNGTIGSQKDNLNP